MDPLSTLDSCIRCGLCEPVCPTYAVSRKRLHGPRGRVQVIKAIVEGVVGLDGDAVDSIFTCLLCNACNLACPAGVDIVGAVRWARGAILRGQPYSRSPPKSA